jgi:predicted transcriptional regulator
VKQENVVYFSEKEEELVNLLFEMGIKRSVAKVLVFLAKTPRVTSRVIERGTDLRQSEVAMVMLNLNKEGWIKNRENRAKSKGRPAKIYELAIPIAEILNGIEERR